MLPALDYCLKCSHLFNVLDASGSIGVTERTAYILRVRQLAVAIAKAWARRRPTREGGQLMDRELLLEIGVEEMPASWLPALTAQLAARLRRAADRRRAAGEGARRGALDAAAADGVPAASWSIARKIATRR